MAVKISDLPVKNSAIDPTDLLEIAEVSGGGHVSKSVTGQEIIDGVSAAFVPYTGATANVDLNTNDLIFGAGAGVLLDNASRLREGTIDAGTGGTKGIAQICGVGYELKWEAGSQYVMNGNGDQVRIVNYKFNIAPTVTNDITEGFYVGSRWILDDGTIYTCSDSTTGAAVWDLQLEGTVTSVDLTMPSAFTVTGNPITTAGTLAVAGAGVSTQYIRGDGQLANFPTTSGGGASVSYYLNGSVSQGTFGGVAMKEINKTPIIGAGTDFTINADGYIQSFITDANDPSQLSIPGGNWNFETYFSASSSGGTPSFYVELYKWDGATLTLIASNSANPEGITGGTAIDLYLTALAVPQTTLALTDRLVVRIYVTHSGRTITLHTEDNHLSQIITTFSTGLTALNGLTAQVQNLAVGTSGTDFAISSVTSTHTFNLPTASATNRGALSSADWTTFNGKASYTPRVQTVASSATVTAVSTNDIVTITAQAVGLTLANPTGTFSEGQSLIIRIKDNGTARAIAYGTNFRAIGVTAPTTTVISKTTYIGCIYNDSDSKFDIVGTCTEA